MANQFNQILPGQKYVSTYVPTPFGLIQNAVQNQQNQYDVEEQNRLNLLGKDINFLPQDIEVAQKAKQDVNNLLQSYANKDLTDPSIRTQFHRDAKTVSDRFGNFGDIGAIQSRKQQHDIALKNLEDYADKNKIPEYIKEYQKKQFETNLPKFGRDTQGNYMGVGVPKIVEHLEPVKRLEEGVKDIAYQQIASIDPKARQVEGDPFSYYTSEGKIQRLSKNQIYNTLYSKYLADNQLHNSIQQQAAATASGHPEIASKLAGDPFKRDDKGNLIIDPKTKEPSINENSILGHAFEGIANERAFNRADLNMKINENYGAKQKTLNDISFGEGTPIASLSQHLIDPDKLIKKERFTPVGGTDEEIAFAATPFGLKTEYVPGQGKQKSLGLDYGKLDEKEQKVYDNIANNIFPNVKNKEELNGKIKQFVETLGNQQVSTYAESIPNNIVFPYAKDKEGAEGLTYSIFGGTSIKDAADVTGRYINRKFYDPETKETLSGTEFKKKVIDELPKNSEIFIPNQFSNKNPFTLLTGDDKFARSYQVTVGGKQYVMSGADKEIQNGIDVSSIDRAINKISKSDYTPGIEQEIKLPSPEGAKDVKTTLTPKGYSIKYDNKEIIASSPEEVYQEYINSFNK